MKLEPDIMDSMVTGCLRFKGTDALLKRDRKTYDAINLSGAERRSDGFFHITLTDKLREMKRLNQECGPNAHHTAQDSPHVTVRPTIANPPATGSGEDHPGGPPTPPPAPVAPAGLAPGRVGPGPERPLETGSASTVKPGPAAGPAAAPEGAPEGQAPEGSAGSGEPNQLQ